MKKIKNLVFSGGGIKGICYIGIIKKLEEEQLLKNIVNIATSSIGSIFGLLLSLGYTYDEQTRLLFGIDIKNILDIYNIDLKKFGNNFGIHSGESLTKFIKLLINKKTGKDEITFDELFKLSGKNLIITGTCLTKQCIKYFNYKDTPDMLINEALRITYCVPFMFDKINFKGDIYVDGGLLDNFPMDYFKENIKETLGVSLRGKTKVMDLDNLDNYILALLYVPSESKHNTILEIYKSNIILVETDIQIFDITISKEVINDMIVKGYNAISEYLNNN